LGQGWPQKKLGRDRTQEKLGLRLPQNKKAAGRGWTHDKMGTDRTYDKLGWDQTQNKDWVEPGPIIAG
jgi:hypothetical protein